MRSHRKKRLDRALITFALISASSLASAKTPQQQANGRTAISAADFAESVGGQLSSFSDPALKGGHRLPPNAYNQTAHVRAFTFTRTSTGWDEPFLIGFPAILPTDPKPLLVLWHKWSTSEYDTWANTSFFEEATSMGWYVIAPRAAHEFHYGIEYGQRNTEELIEFMDEFISTVNPNLVGFDKTKIYAADFSMGGSAVAYGCRHLDPNGFPFAAIFNLSGMMSAAHGWEDLPSPPISDPTLAGTELRNHPLMFGGSPGDPAFSLSYQIASTVHLWPPPFLTVDPSSDLLRNIPEINVYNTYVTGDPNDTALQTVLAFQWAATAHAGITSRFIMPGLLPAWTGERIHTWKQFHSQTTINESWVAWWLNGRAFTKPSGKARILADRDVRYYDISVTQDPSLVAASPSEGILSPFEFDVSNVAMPTNTLWLKSSQETAALEIHSSDMGLNTTPGSLLTLDLEGSPTPFKVVLNDFTAAPSLVTRIPPTSTGADTWSFTGSQLTIHESDPSSMPTWTIQ